MTSIVEKLKNRISCLKSGHVWGKWEFTEEDHGTRTCSRCGHVQNGIYCYDEVYHGFRPTTFPDTPERPRPESVILFGEGYGPRSRKAAGITGLFSDGSSAIIAESIL